MVQSTESLQPLVLIVDDEVRILNALKRLLRKEPFRLATTTSSDEALALIQQQVVSLVVSDFKMPGLNGLELMAKIKSLSPETGRVLMSGNAELQLVIEGVNAGLISQFLTKPFNDDTFKITMKNRLEAQQLQVRNKDLLAAVQAQNQLLTEESEKVQKETLQKERLFATISHEIRNPLHGIQGILELLIKGNNDNETQLLSSAIASAAFMQNILDDVLDYGKVEAGKMVLQSTAFSPFRLVSDLLDLMRPLATGQQLTLEVVCSEAMRHRYFKGDDFRIRQIVSNLLTNAIKYTHSGGVVVEISCNEALTFSVADTGIGIPSEKMASLFEAYVMASDEHDREFGGTGLGLTIVKNLIDLMHGSVSVQGREDGGSVFTVVLPLAETATPEIKSGESRDVGQFLSGMEVVVIDDMETNLIIVENLLPRYGAKVHAFNQGEDLIEFLMDSGLVPDLLLLDINMPDLRGDEVLRKIKAVSQSIAEVPAFAMSGSLDFEGSEQVLAVFTGLLSKPFSVGQLLKLARQFAPRRVQGEPLMSTHEPRLLENVVGSEESGEVSGTTGLLDDAVNRTQASGLIPDAWKNIEDEMGDELLEELVLAFKSSLGKAAPLLEQIDLSGLAVIDIAHSLKPTATMLGFDQLSRCCHLIDDREGQSRGAAANSRLELFQQISLAQAVIEGALNDMRIRRSRRQ